MLYAKLMFISLKIVVFFLKSSKIEMEKNVLHKFAIFLWHFMNGKKSK